MYKTYKSELTYDFRKEYGLSLYECIFSGMSIRELWDLFNGLLTTPGTKFNSVYWDVERYSMTDLKLIQVQNSVINSWDAKVSTKKKALVHPKQHTTPEDRKGQKRFVTQDHLDRVRSRVGAVAVETEIVEKEYYHIDKKKIVRKCRKNGVDCKISNNHYSDKDDAINFLNS